MTRLNVVPVECLSNQHLLAEYKEITRPFNKVIKRIDKYGFKEALTGCIIPEKYTLGAGHETFFFDKLGWLFSRYHKLANEMERRGFNVDWAKRDMITWEFKNRLMLDRDNIGYSSKYWNNYNPTPEAFYLNMARLAKRSKMDNVLNELQNGA